MTGKRRITRKKDYEYHHQVDFVEWLKSKNIKHFATLNGIHVEAAWRREQLKAMGLSPGIPDLVLLGSRIDLNGIRWHGLFIEMKKEKGGVVSDNQKKWINDLIEEGYKAQVANGFKEAIKIACEYYSVEP